VPAPRVLIKVAGATEPRSTGSGLPEEAASTTPRDRRCRLVGQDGVHPVGVARDQTAPDDGGAGDRVVAQFLGPGGGVRAGEGQPGGVNRPWGPRSAGPRPGHRPDRPSPCRTPAGPSASCRCATRPAGSRSRRRPRPFRRRSRPAASRTTDPPGSPDTVRSTSSARSAETGRNRRNPASGLAWSLRSRGAATTARSTLRGADRPGQGRVRRRWRPDRRRRAARRPRRPGAAGPPLFTIRRERPGRPQSTARNPNARARAVMPPGGAGAQRGSGDEAGGGSDQRQLGVPGAAGEEIPHRGAGRGQQEREDRQPPVGGDRRQRRQQVLPAGEQHVPGRRPRPGGRAPRSLASPGRSAGVRPGTPTAAPGPARGRAPAPRPAGPGRRRPRPAPAPRATATRYPGPSKVRSNAVPAVSTRTTTAAASTAAGRSRRLMFTPPAHAHASAPAPTSRERSSGRPRRAR